jgi:HSP20 family protein
MSSLIRWDPFGRGDALEREMRRDFDRPFLTPLRELAGAELSLDMYETEQNLVVKATAPGIKPEDLTVTVVGEVLTIKGESKGEEKVEEKDYIRRERRVGLFQRTVTLPERVLADEAVAEFENGVLTLTLPKAKVEANKTVKVTVK